MIEARSTLKRLKALPKLFRKQDVEKITPHAAMFLYRAAKDGVVYRLNRGNYVNSFLYGFPSVEEVACFLRPPAYISCEWALHYHGISLQAPMVCTVVTLGAAVGRQRAVSYQGITLEYSKITPALFFGFTRQEGFYMASPEKAILDTLYYRRSIPAQDELETEEVDFDLLAESAKRYPQSVSTLLAELGSMGF